jgi:hypothetical protein
MKSVIPVVLLVCNNKLVGASVMDEHQRQDMQISRSWYRNESKTWIILQTNRDSGQNYETIKGEAVPAAGREGP